MLSLQLNKTTGKLKQTSFLTSRVLEEGHSTRGRATWKGQGRMHQRRAGPGHMPLLGSMGAVLWGSQAKPRFVNSNEKQQGFAKLFRDLSRGYTRWSPSEAGDTVAHKGCWRSLSGIYIYLWVCDLFSSVCTSGRGQCHFKATGLHNMDSKAAIW